MLVSNIKSKIMGNKNKYLIFIILLAFILTFLIFYKNSTGDVLGRFHRDVYLYLIQSLAFDGFYFNQYSYINSLSPLVPFLTSLLFRLGFVSEVSIFFVTSVLFGFSIIGMFYLLKLRFDDIYSVLGVAVYCSFTVIMMWAGNGTIDIPSISLCILGIYFFIKSLDNQKYFYLSLPLLMLSITAKYTVIANILIIFVYFLSKGNVINNVKKYYKNFIGGFLVSLLCLIPFIYFYITHNVFNEAATYFSDVSSTTGVNDFLFYILNINKIIFRYNDFVGLVYVIIMLVGVVFSLYCLYRILKFYYVDSSGLDSFKDKLLYLVLFGSIVGLVVDFLLTSTSDIKLCLVLFYVFICSFTLSFNKVLVRYNKVSGDKYSTFSYDILMFAWFGSQFIFLSTFTVKTYRYGIAFVPPLVFFITYGFKRICEFVSESNVGRKKFLYICICCLLLVSFGHFAVDNSDNWVVDEKQTVEWLKSNVDLDNVNIWSDRPVYAWYLQKDYHYVDNRGDVNNLSRDMLNASADYYISHEPNLVIPHYSKFKVIGSVTIFKCD